MRVIELVLDGFKSYADRTVIRGWDESFNSITGLNGSGKSNILDSICFVLGITNISTVRAQNFQDLIYKQGKAGINKASVTIVFDNSDKKRSPVGFDDCNEISITRQVVIGGTTKYLINGHRAQQHTVQNLFQSVQLNINNPNFLIMQGRITQVLNMKALEILSIIEEAAGTRMFEDRKQKALKTISKKDLKLQEITGLLRDEIKPKLDKLRQERHAYLEFQKTESEINQLTSIVLAHDYILYSQKLSNVSEELKSKRSRSRKLEESIQILQEEIKLLNEDIVNVKTKRDQEIRKGGRFQALEEESKSSSHEIVRLATIQDLKKSNLAQEEQNRRKFEGSRDQIQQKLSDIQQALEESEANFKSTESELEDLGVAFKQKEELLQTLQTGVASKEGQASGYQAQLQSARTRSTEAITEQEQAKSKIKHLEERIKEEEPRAEKAKEENIQCAQELENLKSSAKSFESELEYMGFDPAKEAELLKTESELQLKIRNLKTDLDDLSRKVSNLDFTYCDPCPNFDRRKVKGFVALLFSLKQAHVHAATALEICAGGRLYNLVVDTANTATQLLQNGKLRKRVTIIPLDKIVSNKVMRERVETAKRLAPGKVQLALDLISCQEEVCPAMEFVFGSTLICDDAQVAKTVTFDPSVRLVSVTLDGDVYSPSGTLSGGSAPQSSGMLVTLQKINMTKDKLAEAQCSMETVRTALDREKAQLGVGKELKQKLELIKHKIHLTNSRLATSSATFIIQGLEEMKQTIQRVHASMKEAEGVQEAAEKEIKLIEQDMHEFSSNKDVKLAEIEENVNQLRQLVKDCQSRLDPLLKDLRTKKLELSQVKADLSNVNEQLGESDEIIENLHQEMERLRSDHDKMVHTHEQVLSQLEVERAKLSGFSEELRAIEDAASSKAKLKDEQGFELQELGHQLKKVEEEHGTVSRFLHKLEKDHDWIIRDKELFGRSGTPYDFKQYDLASCKTYLNNLTETFKGMRRKINPKVMNMIENVEKRENVLKNMMRTVLKDKLKIEETIKTLDEYKKEALHLTWEKVNQDFGQMFRDFLPGGFAKLDPPEGQSITDGLEVKVSLGGVWKHSLSELSGGQRSLIALSLILALLRFKPAPMYILDEVDAALDLSHTQNIGRIIKTQFKDSQFIIVSLKDGMFQNANRIFRIKFAGGTSCVQALTPADL